MTDPAAITDPELAARLARLQSRRTPTTAPNPTPEMAAVPHPPTAPDPKDPDPNVPGPNVPSAATRSELPRPRRAVGTKIGTLGASLTAMFGLMALYGVAEQRNTFKQPDPDQIGSGQPGAAQAGLADDFGGAASQGDLADVVPANLVSEPTVPNDPALVAPDPAPAETVPVEAIHAVVVVDEAGNVLSAPAGLDPTLLSAAIAEHQLELRQGQEPTAVVVATTVPVAQPVAVDLAIPEPPPPPRRRSSGGGGGGGGASSGGSSSRAPAPAPAPAPQAQSSGS